MPERISVRRGLWLAALSAGLVAGLVGAASAGGSKVPQGDAIKSKIERLYNGEIAPENTTDREKVFVDIDKILTKDTKSLALKAPDFWVDAVQEGRFSGGKRKLGKKNATTAEDVEVGYRDGKDEKTAKAKMWYHAGGSVNGGKPAPLLVAILEKGMDAKAYIDATWAVAANDDVFKNWIVVAMVDGDDFPVTKDPGVVSRPFAEIRERFNTDANRWYLEAVGAPTENVQTATATYLAHRLAGLILRGPVKTVTSANSALCPTLVVHSKTSAEGTAVFDAYKKIDEKANAEVAVDDVPSVSAFNDQVMAWIGLHPRRVLPSSYTFVTTITETDGEPWTGSLNIVSPAKRGVPTKVTVKYLKDSNTVDIQCENLSEFWLYMNDELLDLDKEVAVFVNGQSIAKKVFERDLRQMIWVADFYGEWGRMFTARYRGVVPIKIEAPPANPAPGGQAPAPAPPAGK